MHDVLYQPMRVGGQEPDTRTIEEDPCIGFYLRMPVNRMGMVVSRARWERESVNCETGSLEMLENTGKHFRRC